MTDKWIPIDNYTFKVGDRVKLRNVQEITIEKISDKYKEYPVRSGSLSWTKQGEFAKGYINGDYDIVSILKPGTDKQYYCQNGDLIEVGKEYSIIRSDYYKVRVCRIKNNLIVVDYKGFKSEWDESSFISLWQEQPDEDGWIKRTTGKQPVADNVMVEVKYMDGLVGTGRAKHESWSLKPSVFHITHYRIVEDKQEPEENKSCLKDIEERLSRLESLMVGDFT